MAYGYIDIYFMDINVSKKINYRFLVEIMVKLKISKKFLLIIKFYKYKYNVHLYI